MDTKIKWTVGLVLTPGEYAVIREHLRKEGLKAGAWMKKLMLAEIKKMPEDVAE